MERISWLMLPQSGPGEIIIIWLYVASPPGRLIRGGNFRAQLALHYTSACFVFTSVAFFPRSTDFTITDLNRYIYGLHSNANYFREKIFYVVSYIHLSFFIGLNMV